MSSFSRNVILFSKQKTCGNAPQHRTGLVKLTISLLFETIGDYLILIGDYSGLIGDYPGLISDYSGLIGDYSGLIGD
jgi:hypothetical protein